MRFAKRTAKKLIQDEALLPNLGGVRLRMTLDKYLWKERDHVTLKELAEWFPRYLYLPRIRDREVLVAAIQDGGKTLTVGDTFATAEAYDEASKRYLGLRIGGGAPSVIGSATCVVKPDVARKQRDAEAVSVAPTAGGGPVPSGRTGAGTKPLTTPSSNEPSQPPVPSKRRRLSARCS